MKYEFVEFYRSQIRKRNNKDFYAGTVHVYVIDFAMDIRGIAVIVNKKNVHFCMPSYKAIDPDTKKEVKYPIISFTTTVAPPGLIDFLRKEVAPEIIKRIAQETSETLA